jgi:ribokinase
LQAHVDVIVVSAIEAEMLAGVAVVETLEGALEAARLLTSSYPEVVTAGGAGVPFADRNGNEITIKALKVKVQSTHGAGDEFIGVLAAELASGTVTRAAAKLVSTSEVDRGD